MSILKKAVNKFTGKDIDRLEEAVQGSNETIEYLQESIYQLEQQLQEVGWQQLGAWSQKEFSREGLRQINMMARIYFLKNPLIKRAVLTQSQYVMGQGINIEAEDEEVDQVVQDFLDDPKNRQELTEQQALMQKETELQLFSNFFFVLFVNRATGKVRVRTIDPDEIEDIITNPEDSKEPWYYKRVYYARKYNMETGQYEEGHQQVVYYPDWNIRRPRGTIGGHPVEQGAYIYHVSVNKLTGMKFGVSEIYAACDWARAYKEFLENWASLVKSLQKFAWKKKTKGTQKQVENLAKQAQSSFQELEAGATAVMGQGNDLEPVKTQGATISAQDGRHLKLMVSAATGIFEHYFGDPSTGNLATAKAMERPMELMFRDRQQLWKSIFQEILNFIIKQSVKAPQGLLNGEVYQDDQGYEFIQLGNDTEGEERSKMINISFPELLEKDTHARVEAIINAFTHQGMQIKPFYNIKYVTRLLLQALGEDNIDEKLEEMFPEGEQPALPAGQEGEEGAESNRHPNQLFIEAMQELREQVQLLAGEEGNNGRS